MKHQAIYNLYPQVTYISDVKGAFDSNGNEVIIDVDAVNNEIKRLENEEQQSIIDKENKKASAKQKLQDLGLTIEEIKEAFGL